MQGGIATTATTTTTTTTTTIIIIIIIIINNCAPKRSWHGLVKSGSNLNKQYQLYYCSNTVQILVKHCMGGQAVIEKNFARPFK